jgi:hypothetical protein
MFVLSNLDVYRLNNCAKFGFQDVAAISVEQLIRAVEPMVGFQGNFPEKSC